MAAAEHGHLCAAGGGLCSDYGLLGRFVLVFGKFAALGSLAGIVGPGAVAGFGTEKALAGVIVALVIGVASAALHGFMLPRAAPGRLARQTGQHVLIATVEAGIALREYLRLTQGAEMRWLPPLFNQPIPLMRAGDFVTTMPAPRRSRCWSGFWRPLASWPSCSDRAMAGRGGPCRMMLAWRPCAGSASAPCSTSR
jgi:branched-chain amino acid transport system permease protein